MKFKKNNCLAIGVYFVNSVNKKILRNDRNVSTIKMLNFIMCTIFVKFQGGVDYTN